MLPPTRDVFRGAALALAAFAQLACHGLTELDVTYESCVTPRLPYTEQFDHGYPELADRCWKAENVTDGRRLEASEDLLLTYLATARAVSVSDDPLMLLRELTGDFVIVTHVEVTERQRSSFCLNGGDAAGLVVETNDPMLGVRRSALLVAPDPLAMESDGTRVDCTDDSDHPPPVRVSVGDTQSDYIWEGGEADIAVCRSGERLAYFFRQPKDPDADWQAKDWTALAVPTDDDSAYVGTPSVSAGPIATIGPESLEVQVQGAFNWFALPIFADDCLGPLQDMNPPSND
jgi:hypothetical protein